MVGVAVAEGGFSGEQLEEEYSEAIVVELVGVALLAVDLWGHGVGGAAEGVGPLPVDLLGEAHVDHGDSACLADHEVGGLDVPVDVSVLVKVLEDECDLCYEDEGERMVEFSGHLE